MKIELTDYLLRPCTTSIFLDKVELEVEYAMDWLNYLISNPKEGEDYCTILNIARYQLNKSLEQRITLKQMYLAINN